MNNFRSLSLYSTDSTEKRPETEDTYPTAGGSTDKHLSDSFMGSTPYMKELMKTIDKVAKSNAPTILLEGESGTGKNSAARLIHTKSKQASYNFVEINCASLPETLIESELFGHERGAFTDAKQLKKGLFEIARGGTIFLDEIGEMSTFTQAKLLHVIENHTYRRIGGTDIINSQVRVIAATSINLKDAVASKRFREDLYFRLQLIPIAIPALRERSEDIILLAEHFIHRYNHEYKRMINGITAEAQDRMKLYSWPGNVRELKNMIERIAILENIIWIESSHLPPEIRFGSDDETPHCTIPDRGVNLDHMEKNFIIEALKKTNGNQSRAAKLLGITRHTLRYRMEKFGLGF